MSLVLLGNWASTEGFVRVSSYLAIERLLQLVAIDTLLEVFVLKQSM